MMQANYQYLLNVISRVGVPAFGPLPSAGPPGPAPTTSPRMPAKPFRKGFALRTAQWAALLLALLLLAASAGADFPGEDVDELIRSGLDLTMRGQHARALACFSELQRLRPGHPAGYLYRAAAWERWMEDEQDDSAQPLFYALLDSAIAAGERMAADRTQDPWAYAFLGAAYGLRSMHDAQRDRWWRALRDGPRSLSRLRQSLDMDPHLCDAYVGIGTYLYWRSRRTKDLAGLPFLGDKRAEGIRLLQTAAKDSRYSRTDAKCQLLWILVKEGRYTEACTVGGELYARYPTASVVVFGYAAALMGARDLDRAEGVYTRALERYQPKGEAHPHTLECLWGLAKTCAQRGQMARAGDYCRRILAQPAPQHGSSRWPERKYRMVRGLLERTRRAR